MPGAFLHTLAGVAALAARVLRQPIASVARHEHGIVNAVYFVEAASGRSCVVRVSERRDRDYVALEVWAFKRAEAAGAPVPRLLAHEIDPEDFPEPYLITERVLGLAGDSAELSPDELLSAYEDLGRHLARLHAVTLPGFGELVPTVDGFAGPRASWCERLHWELDAYQRQFVTPSRERALAKLHEIRAWLVSNRPLFALQAGSLVHGDLQGKNFLVRDGRVAAILDFECAESGDPAMDCRVFHYWDSKGEALLEAYQRGYGAVSGGGAPADIGAKLAFYEFLYALLRLCDAYRDGDERQLDRTFTRIERIERRLT